MPSIHSFHISLLLLFALQSAHATLTFGPILQCSPVSVSFTPPSPNSPLDGTTSLTILPLGLPPVVFPFSPRLTNGEANERRSIILTALPFAAGTQFVASLTNQRGAPLSLTSALLSIAPPDSSSPENTNTTGCLTSPRPPTRSFALLSNPAQCQDFTVWYNATAFNSSGVPAVPRVRVYVPSGVELLLNNTGNSVGVLPEGVALDGGVGAEDGFARYRMAVAEGREVVLMFDGGNGVREVTDLITVSPSTSTDCLQAERDALAALTPSSDPNSVRPSRAIIIGAATGGGAVLLIALAMTFFILRDKRHRALQKQRRARVIRRVRSMSESMFGLGSGGNGGVRGDTFMFPRRIRSASYPGTATEKGSSDDREGGVGGVGGLSYANHPYAAFDRGSSGASIKSYVVVDRPSQPQQTQSQSQSTPRPTSLSQIQRDGPYQPRPSLGAQSAETREISPLRFSRYGYGENDPDRLSLTSLDIEGMLNQAAVQEDGSGRSREGSVPGLQQGAKGEGERGETRPRLESRMSSENVVPTVLLSNNSQSQTGVIPQVNLPTPPPEPTPTAPSNPPRPPPVIVRTRSRRTLKVNSDIPDGAFSGTNSFVSSYSANGGGEGDDGAESMTGWSPVYPSAYFRSSAYVQPGLSPGSEAALRVMSSSSMAMGMAAPPPRLEELRQESYGSSSLVSSSEESSLTKGIIPFPDGRQDEYYPDRQPALASSSSVLPKPAPSGELDGRKESSDSNSSVGGQNAGAPPLQRTGSMRDSSSSSYAIPSPSAFPAPPSSIPKVQYPYRPTTPLRPGGSSGLRTLPPVTTSFTRAPQPSSASSSQPSAAALSSGVTHSTGIATSGSSKPSIYSAPSPSGSAGNANLSGSLSPSSFPTLPAYSPLRDPPPFSALSPPSDSVLSSLWSGRPALSPLMEQSDSPVSSTSAGSRQALLPPLSTSNLTLRQQQPGSARSPLSQSSSGSQLPSPASVRIASKGDVVTMAPRRTQGGGGSVSVNGVGSQGQGQSQLRRGGSVSTNASGTGSRQTSTIGEEYYGIAR